ncbi:hypothetical protein CPSG_01801 [Coccidioides posadasii str. Silveira]|uniref:Uncharacterized protein n=2 Tax=Coccidioides posadasii TaxID=199306 RepID=E9CWG8_COCPS|nr:hypothetical protein CPSG_01801 [Coccidioides posadasii str. Silveira]KMM65115.1 hypothetical protein CPAG_01468 [Coccidioides posadasii RMSCC 3488]
MGYPGVGQKSLSLRVAGRATWSVSTVEFWGADCFGQRSWNVGAIGGGNWPPDVVGVLIVAFCAIIAGNGSRCLNRTSRQPQVANTKRLLSKTSQRCATIASWDEKGWWRSRNEGGVTGRLSR